MATPHLPVIEGGAGRTRHNATVPLKGKGWEMMDNLYLATQAKAGVVAVVGLGAAGLAWVGEKLPIPGGDWIQYGSFGVIAMSGCFLVFRILPEYLKRQSDLHKLAVAQLVDAHREHVESLTTAHGDQVQGLRDAHDKYHDEMRTLAESMRSLVTEVKSRPCHLDRPRS